MRRSPPIETLPSLRCSSGKVCALICVFRNNREWNFWHSHGGLSQVTMDPRSNSKWYKCLGEMLVVLFPVVPGSVLVTAVESNAD